jgi:hypothetical protein
MNATPTHQTAADGYGLPNQQVWHEAMAHLRHLSDDVWKSFRLFLTLDGFIITLSVARLWIGLWTPDKSLELVTLALIGAVLTLSGRYLLKRHRVYYLQMLARKSLIEKDLGFYSTNLSDTTTDLAFPWRLSPEVVSMIQQDFDGWVKRAIRSKGTIARVQFWIYDGLLAAFCGIALISILRFSP